MSRDILRSEIPASTLDQLDGYVMHGRSPGSFVRAVLENNLMGAFSNADEDNLRSMRAIVQYVHAYLPFVCYGSPDDVRGWLTISPDARALVTRRVR